jgi:hypothetical protein
MNPIQARLLEIIFRMFILGEKPQKSTAKEIRLRMSLLSTLCIIVLFSFHYQDELNWIFNLDKINIFLPLLFFIVPSTILYFTLYWIPVKASVLIGSSLTVWVVTEIIYRTINV